MNEYIFISREGYTFQPDSTSSEPDIENSQVIGFASGYNSEEAFKNLLKENHFLLQTNFDKIISYELSHNFERISKFFYLSEIKNI